MREAIINWLKAHGISPELSVFIIALLPIVELRGAIPVGINLYQLNWSKVFLLAFLGNLLPVPFLLLFLENLANLLSRIGIFAKFFNWLFTRTRKKGKVIEEYKFWGLLIFVGIPLPGTGAWTGSIAAFLLGMDFKSAIFAIIFGVGLAGILVTGLSRLGIWGVIIALLALLILIFGRRLAKWLR